VNDFFRRYKFRDGYFYINRRKGDGSKREEIFLIIAP